MYSMLRNETDNSLIESTIEKQLRRLRDQENVIKNALLIKTRHNILNNITSNLDIDTLADAEKQIMTVNDLTSSMHAVHDNNYTKRYLEDRDSLYRSTLDKYHYSNDEFKYELIPTKLKKKYEELDTQMRCCSICARTVLGYEPKKPQLKVVSL